MRHYRTTLLVAFSILAVSVGIAEATGKRQCAEDYRRFCGQWGLETADLKTACDATATISRSAASKA
ncbi:MAG: hypothetical protein R3D01_13325 [Hyphomicrobiales bacterium]